jgi:hypothetical protein
MMDVTGPKCLLEGQPTVEPGRSSDPRLQFHLECISDSIDVLRKPEEA